MFLRPSGNGELNAALIVEICLMSILDEYTAQDSWRNWESMIERLPIEGDQVVLDLGCGPGFVADRLAMCCKQVIGVDQEATYLDAAKRRCSSNNEFVHGDLANLVALNLPLANGLWSSFVAAYFPDFTPVIRQWAAAIMPGGWLAVVEVDDMFVGHRSLPKDIQAAFIEFSEYTRSIGRYDFSMGRRLVGMCRSVGLEVISEHALDDQELAFQGASPTFIQAAWEKRFARMQGMKSYFGEIRFQQVVRAFQNTISAPEHTCTASVVMVLARKSF